jgi:oligosaccharyltransferase complex subunit alpha (ribophorin I)
LLSDSDWPCLSGLVATYHHHFCELQVYYEFNPVFMLAEPLMLISAALLFFVACIAYLHMDLSIGKSQAS